MFYYLLKSNRLSGDHCFVQICYFHLPGGKPSTKLGMIVTRSLNCSHCVTKLRISCRFFRIESPHKLALFQEIGQVCSGPWTTNRGTRAQSGTINEFA